MATKQEFAGKIREKYNAYQDVDDNTLVDKFLEKYPVYKDRVDTEPSLIDTAVNTVKDIASPMKKAYKTYLDVVSPAEKLGVDVAKSAAQAAIDRSSFERFEKTLPEEPQPTPFSSKEEFRKANVVQKLSKMAQDPAMWLIAPPGMNMPTLPAKAAKQVVSADVALTSALAKAKAGQELSEAEAKAFKAWQEGQAKIAGVAPKALPPRNEVAAYEEALVGKPNRPVPELPSLTPEVKKNVSQLGELPKSVQAKSPTSLGIVPEGAKLGLTPLSATERASALKNLPAAVFGIEPTYDENGKQTGYRYNVGKGLMGVAGAGAIRAGGGKFLRAAPKGINLKNLKSLEPKLLDEMSAAIKPELEKVRGKTLSHAEVLDAAKDASILQKTFSREQTLAEEAAILRARQALAAASTSKGITKEYLDTLKSVHEYATSRARQLGALGIKAEPIEAELAINKNKLIEKLLKIGKSTDEILKAGENVDWQDLQSVTKFYRSFVKPTLPEILDEYRYINLLSSPKTHIVNFTSNALQVAGLAPATKLFTGGIDAVGSAMTGKARQAYAAEAGAYYKGSVNSINEASKKALEVLRGAAKIARPDVAQIPTGAKLLKPFQIIPRALEASDVFFRTIAEGGEKNALAFRYAKQGKELTETAKALINEEAKNKAAYSIFRMPNDPQNLTGQGYLLTVIDKFTQNIVKPLRRDFQIKDRTIWNPAKLLIPFVETPMNIFKQGLEYSPAGVFNLPGATNKQEQLAKALIGSTVALGAYGLAVNGNTTWKAPANEKDRQIFYDSGRKPYSVKIGDKWVGYSRLGPIAYPIALATAVNWFLTENPKAATETNEKRLMNVLSGIGGYFADQSYVEGLNNILQVLSGDVRGTAQLIGNAPSQYIPLSSLMRWANSIIDNVYRQSEKGFSLKSTIQNIAKGIPGASQTVPPILGPTGEPQKRPFPLLNAVSPLDISQYSPEKEQQLKGLYSARRLEAVGSQQREQLKTKAQELFNAMKSDPLELQYKKLAKVYAGNEELGDQLETLLEEQTMQFTGEDKLIKSLNAKSGARAEYIKSKLKGLDKTQRNAFLVDLDNKGLLDDTTMELLSQ